MNSEYLTLTLLTRSYTEAQALLDVARESNDRQLKLDIVSTDGQHDCLLFDLLDSLAPRGIKLLTQGILDLGLDRATTLDLLSHEPEADFPALAHLLYGWGCAEGIAFMTAVLASQLDADGKFALLAPRIDGLALVRDLFESDKLREAMAWLHTLLNSQLPAGEKKRYLQNTGPDRLALGQALASEPAVREMVQQVIVSAGLAVESQTMLLDAFDGRCSTPFPSWEWLRG